MPLRVAMLFVLCLSFAALPGSAQVDPAPKPAPAPAPGPGPAPIPPPIPNPGLPPIRLPSVVKGDAGKLIEVAAETTGKVVRWESLDDDLLLTPPGSTDAKIWVIACKAGKYRLIAWTAVDGVPSPLSRCEIQVGNGPEPPAPVDRFSQDLAAAYKADITPAKLKAAQVVALTGLYEAMGDHARDPKITTLADLLDDLRKASMTLVPASALPEVRKVIGSYLVAQVGDDPDIALTDTSRAKAAAVFGVIAKALDGLK